MRNSKVSVGKKSGISMLGYHLLYGGFGIHLPRRDFRLRVRMEYGKKGEFSVPKKVLIGAYQSSWQVQLMQAASTLVIS